MQIKQSNFVVVVACKIQCEKEIFKLVKKISIKCCFWLDWCNRVIFIYCFEKRSIDHLLNNQISLSLRKSKKSMQKKNLFDRTIISITFVDACDNDNVSISIQDINIAMQTIDVSIDSRTKKLSRRWTNWSIIWKTNIR